MKYATSLLVALSAAGYSAAATVCNGYAEVGHLGHGAQRNLSGG